ncbi:MULTISPECIES: hypothetical protein [Marinovum]|jgi:hypothetical protein|uniref:Sulfotransferase family protein n=1 Tax=Marinovum algicola TaxID=42444 RepID=A0A975W848_9RHOB|nr:MULTISPECIES: hypothetical protein [Marinovum]MDD9739693.1 hypothetical protein [Marinovum sp. SP66]SEJ03115.1 hypothetical protein SAMN04487940_10312 [Marinovum algicola]SLN18230.1 hypothetical protein MAA5396_00524 [Marinovum algicola]
MRDTILTDLAGTGWAIRHSGSAPKRFQVMGERSSGTNFVKRLIDGNTWLGNSEVLGWKHGVPGMLAIPADFTVVCTFRAADAWALSMHAKPWHARPPLQALGFSDFIRAPWDSRIDRPRYFPWAEAPEFRGQPLQADRHPITGAMFRDLFELRAVKMAVLLSFAIRHSSCVFLRMEAVQAAPEAFLADLRAGLALPATDTAYKPVTKRLGAKFKPAVMTRPETPAEMPEADRAWMRERLDLGVEEAMGYTY